MIKEWIMNVLTTVPYIGNVVTVPYKAKATDKLPKKANFVAIRYTVDVSQVYPLIFTDSDFGLAADRTNKYEDCVTQNKVGEFKFLLNRIQSSTINHKRQATQDLLCGNIIRSGMTTPVAFTRKQLETMQDRYAKMKGKLMFSLTLKQKIAIFLSGFFGIDKEVFFL